MANRSPPLVEALPNFIDAQQLSKVRARHG